MALIKKTQAKKPPAKALTKKPAAKQPAAPRLRRNAHIIAITNQKGGVAKTTTCINLGASLTAAKRRILVVDLDPQANATMSTGIEPSKEKLSIADVLTGKATAKDAIIKETQGLYDLLPSSRDLTAAEVFLQGKRDKHNYLATALRPVRSSYDYILIDCPPALNILTINAMASADGVLVPIQCEYLALRGLADLRETVDGISNTINKKLQIEGLIRTMYDKRNRLAREVSQQLLQVFSSKVYNVIIPRNVRLAEAPSHGLPIISYDKNSTGAITYLALAGEFIRRYEGK